MSFTFDGTTVNGINDSMAPPSPDFRAARTHHWGVAGETEIVSLGGGRDIRFSMVHFDDFTDIEDLLDSLQALDALVGSNGLLTDDTINAQDPPFPASTPANQFPDTTFVSFEQTPFGSQPFPGPLEDVAGCLDGGWFVHLEFQFRQLLWTPNGRRPATP